MTTGATSPPNTLAVVDGIDVTDTIDIDESAEIDTMMGVNSAIAIEKEIAADTIGTLFAATQIHFLPFVEPCTLELVDLLSHYYEGIRKSAIDSLLEIIRTFYDLGDHEPWVPGATVVSEVSWIVRCLVDSHLTESSSEQSDSRTYQTFTWCSGGHVRIRRHQVSLDVHCCIYRV